MTGFLQPVDLSEYSIRAAIRGYEPIYIEEQLSTGKEVELLTASPGQSTWNRLLVDLLPGLEAGLLKSLSPPWNKR